MLQRSIVALCIIGIIGLAVALVPAFAQNADAVVGTWLNGAKDAHIQVFKCSGGKYCGKLVWLKNGDGFDEKNPNPARKKNKILGSIMMWGFKFDGSGTWEDGSIYDAGSGKTYCGKMWLQGSTLQLKGRICYTPLGKTDTWTRVK